MDDSAFVDAPLIKFHLERLVPDPTGPNRAISDPVVAVGNFVSMPHLVGAHTDSHDRYQQDRLFTVLRIEPGGRLVLDVAGAECDLVAGRTIIIDHAGEGVSVKLLGFTSRSVLHQLEVAA
jgi:hypothetical protein